MRRCPSPAHGLSLLLATFALACSSTVTPPAPAAECGYHRDCPNQGVCDKGKCYGTVTCLERHNCRDVPVCANQRCVCPDDTRRCTPVCETDLDCPADGECLNGICTPSPLQLSGTAPVSGARGTLKAGLGRVEVDFPMGIALAGYGARPGPKTPYQDSLGGSNGWFGKPDIRALALDDGGEMVVLLRLPLIFSTDELLTRTAEKVAAKTGLNLLDHIITSATHSHSSGARFWHMAVGLSLGFFGYDEFNREIFERLTDSMAAAVEAAVADLHPARFGYHLIEDFDPQHKIHRDRRHRNNNLPGLLQVDDRLLVMRIDDAAGQPEAVLTNFPIHGTVFDIDNPYQCNDAPGGIEEAVGRRTREKYNRPVLSFFLQGDAGDIAPAGDDHGHSTFEQIQVIGERTAAIVLPAFDAIVTSASTELKIVSGRVPISHDLLYGPGSTVFHDDNTVCEDTPPFFRYGAFDCVSSALDDTDPNTKFHDGTLGCLFAVECLTAGYPIPQIMKTRLTALKLGALVLATIPGEPLSAFGRSVAESARTAVSGAQDAVTLGYSQDHQFYLMGEDDWFQGGYEPSLGLWGWRLGPYLADQSAALAAELNKAPADRSWPTGVNLKPSSWPLSEADKKTIAPTPSDAPGEQVIDDVPAQVDRLDQVVFRWTGGHPGVDRPQLLLEHSTDGQNFSTATREGGVAYDDSGYEMLVRYEGLCDKTNCMRHRWSLSWEERRQFAPGTYRFRVNGQAWVDGQKKPYQTVSRAFELVPSKKLVIQGLTLSATGLEGRITEPRAVARVMAADGSISIKANGHLLRSMGAPSGIGVPLDDGEQLAVLGEVLTTSTSSQAGVRVATLAGMIPSTVVTEERQVLSAIDPGGMEHFESAGQQPISAFSIAAPELVAAPAGRYRVTLSLSDAAGNRGTITATISK